MDELNVNVLYENSDAQKVDVFSKNNKSDMMIELHYDKVEANYDWVELFEGTMRYLDNILRNPNRFLINEEEIVKIEQSKKVGLETIRHLSKHTNFIQDINEKEEVIPSKLLNENKEETLDTYENRFVFTLVLAMCTFIDMKKRGGLVGSYIKDEKSVEYKAASIVGKEKINIELTLKTKLDVDLSDKKHDMSEYGKKIALIEHKINDLKDTPLFKALSKAHVQLVGHPVKKTNVILKNTNFQYAMILWDYIHDHIDEETKQDKKDKKYTDEGELRDFFNETFLLDYLALCTLNKENFEAKVEKEEVVKQVIRKIIDINAGLSEDELKDLVGEQYAIVKYKNSATNDGIAKVFRRHIDKYMAKAESIRLN